MMNLWGVQRRTTDREGDQGVTSIEYGLLATAVALLASAGVFGLGPRVLAIFQSIIP
ncbi:Flp pilus assembly pilin Flp [Aeromicrobium panaciterrae]|uniref:Flp pilus assembly pilin Flp n=1 Tax=Aeromicrobium panaciterrae TaxID=363861 RepID=A0ABU1ULN5_9ACTN|nr:Flp pilus assembly pilin Flp [Aeromicrobium panaciterrae]